MEAARSAGRGRAQPKQSRCARSEACSLFVSENRFAGFQIPSSVFDLDATLESEIKN